MTGAGLAVIETEKGVEVPPPGGGLSTVTWPVPTALRSEARIAAVSCVPVTKVVTRACPFHCTTDADVNPLPLTAMLAPAPPPLSDEGWTEEIEGNGLPATVNAAVVVTPPPGGGFDTETWAVPPYWTSVARMAACNCVLLIYVVDRKELFHSTTDVEAKPFPLTVNVKAPLPAVAVFGEIDDRLGVGVGTTAVKV